MDKVAFHIGTWPIHWYGVLFAAGILVGLWTASRRGVRDGLKPECVLDSGPWIILGAVVGARALYLATYWKESFAGQPWTEIFMVQRGGLVFYGGFIGAVLTVIAYARVRKVPLWKLADALAPSIALGYVFGRLGCLTNGCCYGRFCPLPWAITYPRGHETFPVSTAAPLPVHPTQIYDAVLGLGLYALLAWLYRRKKFDGQVFAAFLVCYAFTRSFVEYFRGDYGPSHRHGIFTPAQLVSVGTLVAGVALMLFLPKSKIQNPKSK